MDPHYDSSFIDGFIFNEAPISLSVDHCPNPVNGIKSNNPSGNFEFMDNPFVPSDPNYAVNPASLSSISMDEGSSLDESDFSSTVLRYMNQMLMEEDMKEKSCMFHDPLSLQAAEKSFYEAIGEEYPSSTSPLQLHDYHNLNSPDDHISANFSDYSSCGNSTGNSFDNHWSTLDYTEYKPLILQTVFPTNFVFQSNSISSSQSSITSNGLASSSTNAGFDSTLLSKNESVLQFEKGVEEAIKFLPKDNQFPFIINPENKTFPPSFIKTPQVVIKTERDEKEYFPTELTGRKNHGREDETDLEEGRSNKHSANYTDESELSDLFDKILLGTGWGKDAPPLCICCENQQKVCFTSAEQNEESNRSDSVKTQVRHVSKKKEVVDLSTLLIVCAQAVSSDDRGTGNELLRQVRRHSSPLGDGSQRLAHYFANALEARLAGTGTQIYTALSSKKTSAADVVKAYQMYILACPFQKLAMIFANHTILNLSKQVETVHIIDFGIRYGFHWPGLIYRLSRRDGGPPNLRITGIEFPQPGFRPGERVQETGRRLAKYCERFNVPFEYIAIAQKWETIQIKDLKLNKNELVVVNCLDRFKNLLDETVVLNSPKDAVLNLIRNTNPNIFIHTILNGCYNAPFFMTRFREALYHYSSFFDMLDTNVDREDPMRLMYENKFSGREIMNIIACEGSQRIERPETYKQWQVRTTRAGFRQLPLDHHLINKFRGKLRDVYHSDFVLDEDRNWMLQGWKGRIFYASSCWVPA